jgi:hypothetical protein
VHRVDRSVLTDRLATLGVSFDDQYDYVQPKSAAAIAWLVARRKKGSRISVSLDGPGTGQGYTSLRRPIGGRKSVARSLSCEA